MSASSDISSLFKQFGGRPDEYQEISQAEGGRESLDRWPSMAKAEVARAASSEQAAVTSGDASLSAGLTRVDPVISSPLPDVAGEPAGRGAAPVASPAPVGQGPWPGESLQSLLGKLAHETRAVVEATAPILVRDRPQLDNIKIIAVVSAKGGVGKTTLAANLATALRRQGHVVLGVDLDPQNALHHHFPAAADDVRPATLEGISASEVNWKQACLSTAAGVFVLPYGSVEENRRRLFERELEQDPDWLAHQLSGLQLVDGAVVVIDTPPGPSLYLQQALAVANLALVVSLADAASYTALPLIDGLIRTYAAGRPDFIGSAYLINQVDNSRQLSKDITQILRNLLGTQIVGLVHRDQAITEALAYNRDVLDYDPHGQGSHDILKCAQVIAERLASSVRHERPV